MKNDEEEFKSNIFESKSIRAVNKGMTDGSK